MLESLAKFLEKESSSYSTDRYAYRSRGIAQAYRLYVLSKYGLPNIGAMNRMRQVDKLPTTSRHLLAAAYALIGKSDIAKELIKGYDIEIKPYRETGYSYGNELRDHAVILEAKMAIGDDNLLSLAKLISSDLSSHRWYSTQSTAYALMSLSKYTSEENKGTLAFSYLHNGKSKNVNTDKSLSSLNIKDAESGQTVEITNNSKGNLYTRILVSGQQHPGTEGGASAKHLNLKIEYQNMEGKSLDISQLKQGTDFKVITTVANLGTRGKHIEELVLNQIFPSGWEIQNQRMSGVEGLTPESAYDYRDIRDDRVNTFFDIDGKKTHTYITYLTATYAGKFYLPTTLVEAMYDNEIQAKTQGQWVEVIR